MKTVFFDVDTQLDFLTPAGALAVPEASKLAPRLRHLTGLAQQHRAQILSTVDAHAEDDPEFRIWKPHCVAGTQGQQKCSQTLLDKRVTLPNSAAAVAAWSNAMRTAPQIVLEKQTIDLFLSENLLPALRITGAERCIVYGLVTEYCVRSAVLGLLGLAIRVELVTDAIHGMNETAAHETLTLARARGAAFVTAGELSARAGEEFR